MPPIPSPTEPDLNTPAPTEPAASSADAPLTFVPHEASGALATPPATLIPAGRYGVMEAHELVKLLSSLDDERARGRFRESVYLSIFFWLIVVALILYGPHYLWHAPQLILPSDVLKQRELTQLNAPVLRHSITPATKPTPKPALDNKTLEKLREITRRTTPTVAPAPTPSAPTTAPTLPQPVAPTPVPTHAPPVVADAPMPQPRSQPSTQPKPNFNSPGSSLGNLATIPRGGGGVSGGDIPTTPRGASAGEGAEILSDTMGVDFDPYIRRLKRDIYNAWIPLLPEETQPPLMKSGETIIVMTILPDGTIGDMKLVDSTRDMAIDKAAWGSIISQGKVPPLPSQFHGPNLVIRWTYNVNPRSR